MKPKYVSVTGFQNSGEVDVYACTRSPRSSLSVIRFSGGSGGEVMRVLRQDLSVGPEARQLVEAASQCAPGILPSTSPALENRAHMTHQVLPWMLGTELHAFRANTSSTEPFPQPLALLAITVLHIAGS